MSALGQKRSSAPISPMSALRQKRTFRLDAICGDLTVPERWKQAFSRHFSCYSAEAQRLIHRGSILDSYATLLAREWMSVRTRPAATVNPAISCWIGDKSLLAVLSIWRQPQILQCLLNRVIGNPDLENLARLFGRGAFQCKDETPCASKASITPSKIRPTPIAETKNPTMRVVASMPMGPIFRVSFSA